MMTQREGMAWKVLVIMLRQDDFREAVQAEALALAEPFPAVAARAAFRIADAFLAEAAAPIQPPAAENQ